MTQFTDQFAVANWVTVPTGPPSARPEEQKWFMVLSGVAFFTFQGTGNDWRRDSLRMAIDLTGAIQIAGRSAPPGRELKFQVEQWAAYSTINSALDERQSGNFGHAADAFRPIFTTRDAFTQIFDMFEVDVAVTNVDALIYRVGYHLTLVGTIVEVEHRIAVPDVVGFSSGSSLEKMKDKVNKVMNNVGLNAHFQQVNLEQPLAPPVPPVGPPPKSWRVTSQAPVAGTYVLPGSSVTAFWVFEILE